MRYLDSERYKSFKKYYLRTLYEVYCALSYRDTGQLSKETQSFIAHTIKSMWEKFEKENADSIENAYKKAYEDAKKYVRWLLDIPVENIEDLEGWDRDIFEYRFEENFNIEMEDLLDTFSKALEEKFIQNGVIRQPLQPEM